MTTAIDDVCRQLQALCKEHSYRSIELIVGCDGGVSIRAYDPRDHQCGKRIDADVFEGACADPLPSVALKNWQHVPGKPVCP